MSAPAGGGGMDFNTMQQLNAGGANGGDKGSYPGAFAFIKMSETGITTVLGDGANVNPLGGAGQKGLLDMLGAGTDQRKGPLAKMMAAMFPPGALKQFAEGSSDNSSGGGGDNGSNHPFSTVGSAVGSGFDGVAQDQGFAAGQAISPSASPGKGAGQDAGMGMQH